MRTQLTALIVLLLVIVVSLPVSATDSDEPEEVIAPLKVDIERVQYYPRFLDAYKNLESIFMVYWCAFNTRGTTINNIQGRLHLLDEDGQERMLLPLMHDKPIPGYARVCGSMKLPYMINSPEYDWLITMSAKPVASEFETVNVTYLPQVDTMPFNTIGASREDVIRHMDTPWLEDTMDHSEYGGMKRMRYMDMYIFGFSSTLEYLFKDRKLVAMVAMLTGNEDDILLRLSDYEALRRHVESEYKAPAYSYEEWLNEWFEGDESKLPMALVSGMYGRGTVWLMDDWFSVVRTMYSHGSNISVIFVTADRKLFFDEETGEDVNAPIEKKERRKPEKKRKKAPSRDKKEL